MMGRGASSTLEDKMSTRASNKGTSLASIIASHKRSSDPVSSDEPFEQPLPLCKGEVEEVQNKRCTVPDYEAPHVPFV